MFGYKTPDAVLKTGPWISTPEDAREQTRAQFERGLQSGISTMHEMATVRIRARFTTWPVDWEGQPAMQVLVTDETQAHAAELTLQRAQEESDRIEEEHRIALIAVNAQLEQKVQDRTRDLAQSNNNLADANLRMEQALDTQRSTQVELVQLKKSSLNDFLVVTTEGAHLLESALRKAHALFTNFHQVANDPSEEPRAVFSVPALLESMQSALQPIYDDSPVSLVFALEADIEIDNYQGHLTQVLSQLIDNAKAHAFTGLESGRELRGTFGTRCLTLSSPPAWAVAWGWGSTSFTP